MASLQEQIGQMLMVGFRGTRVSSHHPIIQDIQKYHLGGIILFDYDVPTQSTPRNIVSPQQLEKLTTDLQQAASSPLFISIDQEGGVVNRLKTDYGFPATFSHQQLASMDDAAVMQAAAAIAETLRSCHINVNFAPCVDVAINPQNPVIAAKQRSFSADADVVSHLAEIYIQAHHQHKVFCALKHFPGHGSSLADTHLGIADVTATWSEIELQPYKTLIDKSLPDMIMVAHVYHQLLDADFPASLSHKIIQGILREKLGWQGVVITDDLQMGAIRQQFSLKKTLQCAINAGNDILLLGNNLQWDEHLVATSVTLILELLQENKILPEQIEQSYHRIQTLKGI